MLYHYIYGIQERPLRPGDPVYYKIGYANDLDRRKASMQTANPRQLELLFVLGPFLDRYGAEHIESQLHSLLRRHRVRGEWFTVNPLSLAMFWDWVEAQLLSISVQDESLIPSGFSPCALDSVRLAPIQRLLDLS